MPEVTLEELAEIMEEMVDLSNVPLRESAVLGEDIPIDSMDMLRIISRIESRYKLRFMPSEVFGLNSVGDLLQVIRSR